MIAHRDLKSSNVMMGTTGDIKLSAKLFFAHGVDICSADVAIS
jgi:hypothetical protein